MDWKQIIGRLQASGMSQPQIAARCRCGQATISDLASGKTSDPRHSLGQALQLLAREVEEAASRQPAAASVGSTADRRVDHETAAQYANTLVDRRAPAGEGA